MENQNQNTNVIFPNSDANDASSSAPIGQGTILSQPQSLDPVNDPLQASSLQQQVIPVAKQEKLYVKLAKRADVILALLLIMGSVGLVLSSYKADDPAANSVTGRFETTQIPLNDFVSSEGITFGTQSVTINGSLQAKDGLIIAPTLQPTSAVAGQIYYDQTSNLLSYYNGSQFVALSGPAGGVQSLGGLSGQINVGGGLGVAGGQLSNTGVLSVQGLTGNVTLNAGNGIAISGTTISNAGVVSVTSGSPAIVVSDDGNGNITLTGSGSGTVSSTGGTTGFVPLFTGAQTIEDSIITQSGMTVTINGDLSVVTGGLSLSNALTVSNGGTGTTSLAANGVIVGAGTGALSSVTAGGPGLCLLSTAGAPNFAVCPSASGVTSLNGLTGGLNVANASGAGTTITIDNASTVTKGIASFSPSNFTASSGAINTIQDINTGATPTFVGVNTNTITPSAPLTVGVSAQTALLQGSTTTITSNGVGNDIVLNSADTIELQDDTNVTGNIAASGDVAVNGGDLTAAGALNITPGGTLTVGVGGQTLTLQGNASTSLRSTNAGNTTIVGFVSPTANTTLNFPALTAGTYTICTSSGNCPSAAAGSLQDAYNNSTTPEIVLDATRGALTIRDSAGGLGANLLEVQNNAGGTTYLAVNASGIAVTGTAAITGNINSSGGALQTGGTTRIDNTGNATNIGSLTLSGAVSGGTTFTGSGNINTTGGAIQTNSTTRIDNSGNLVNIAAITASGNATLQGGTITLGTTTQQGSLVLHDGNGQTATLSVGNALVASTAIAIPTGVGATDTICLLTLANCVGTGGGVSGSGTNNQLAKFTSTGSTIGDSTITDDGTAVTTSVDLVIQGGDATIGVASGQTGTLNFAHSGSAFFGSIVQGALTGNRTYTLPDASGIFCNSSGNCLGGGGGGANTALSNLTGVAINTSLLPGTAGTVNLGSGTLPFGDVFLAGTSGTPGTNNFRITGASTGGTRVITLPDATGTVCLQASTACGFALATGSTNYIQNQTAVDQPADFQISGSGIAATFNATTGINTGAGDGTLRLDAAGNLSNIVTLTLSGAISGGTTYSGSGNINTTGGGLQTNSTTRVDNSGNLTNIGNITGTGAITIASSGAGNDIIINGADTLDVQDAATFASTLGVTGTTTLSGDAALNGTNINLGDAATDLLTISAVIQGGSPLVFEGGTVDANELTIAIATLTADQTITFPDATGEVCLTTGNCAGSGGGVTTLGGTIGTLPVFTGAQTIGDSLLSQAAGTVTANGNLNLTTGNQYRINGTQISSADLSNDANLAKLASSQTFTGATNAFQNGVNSTNAFNIQNAAGTRILTIDSANGQAILGVGSTLNGRLVFNNSTNNNTVTFVSGAVTGNRTLTLPDSSGILCNDSGNCAGVGATLQTGYNFSAGGTTPKIKLNSTLNGVDIQDADTTIGADLFDVRASNAGGLGAVMFGVGNTGQITLQNSVNSVTALRLLTQGGTSVLTGDTTNGQIILGQSSTLNGTLVFNNATNGNQISLTTAAASGSQTITLPNATGTVCLSIGNCDGAGSTSTLQAAYDAGNTITTSSARDITFNLAESAADANFLVDLQCDTTCGANGRFAAQDDGVDILSVAPTAITVGSATTNVPVTISSGTGAINIGNGAQARTVNVGTGAAAQTVTLGSTNTTSTTLIQAGSGNITLNSSGTIELQDTTNIAGNLTVTGTAASALVVKASTNGTSAIAADFQQSDSDSIMRLTDTGSLGIGNTTGIAGTVALSSGTAFSELRATNVTAARILQAPDVSGTICTDAGNCGTTTGTLQNAYSYSAGGATPEIKLDTTRNGIEIQDANTTIGSGQNFLSLRGPNAAGLGSVLVGFGTQGNLFMQPSTNRTDLIDINTNGGANLLTVDSVNSRVGIALGGSTLPTHTLDVGGNTNLRGAGTGDALTVSNATSTGNIAVFNDNATAVATIADGGSVLFRNQTNSATAFQVQNATGADTLFTIDTATRGAGGGNLVKIGNSTGTDGALTVLQLDATTANPTSNLAALNGSLFYNSTTHKVSLIENGQVKIICNTTDLGCGTGTVTLQNAYNNSIGGATSEIIVDATRGALDIQDRSTANGGTIGANLLNVRATAATDGTAGTTLLSVGNTGSVLSQNSTNSANAFRILNATGGELAGVDSTDSMLRLLANNTGHLSGTGANWNTGTALPAGRSAGAAVAVNGYVYHIGGCDAGGGATTTVYYARTNSDGTLGSWTATTSIPQTMCGGVAATYNGYIYVNGGTGTSANSRDVYYAKPNSDGTITTWATQNDPTGYTVGLKDNGMAAYNGHLYITGGYSDDGLETANQTVYYARINADGSVPSFTAQTLWLPANDFNPGNTTVANGYLYVFGTANYDKFFYGRINADGSVAASVQSTGTTGARKYGSIAVMNGYMYAIAGATTPVNTVSYGALANNGDIAAFTTDTTTIPATRWLCSKNSPVVNNYIYLIGCANASDVAQTTVYYAGGSRVKVGASLDLVGNSGEGMSEGGTGGQLTAGNTFVNGTLSVTGNSLLKDGAMVGNILTVNGTTNIQTTTNSTTGFQVLNAAGVPQFSVDTTTSRTYVGNPTADTTGALLVLDTKSSAGDPTGVAGGMYYNSSLGAMRCYQDGFWRDCITDNPRNSYHVYSDLNGALDSSGNNQFDIQMYTEGTGSNSTVTGVASHPGIMRKIASATNDLSAIQETSSVSDVILLGNGNTWRYETAVRIPTVSDGTNSFIVRSGFLDNYATAEGGDGCYFKYSHDVNAGEWQGVCVDAGTTTCDTNIAVTAGTWYRLTVVVSSDGATTDFRINGTSTCTVSANIPDTTGNETGFANYIRKTLGATARDLDTDYVDVLGQFGTPR